MSSLPNTLPEPLRNIRALVFDLFGTCLDWHTPLLSALKTAHPEISEDEWSTFAFAWRTAFLVQTTTEGRKNTFRPAKELYSDGLDDVLKGAGKAGEVASKWTDKERASVSAVWSQMIPFEDTVAGVDLLRQKLAVVGLSNGSAPALIPMCKSAGLSFDLLLTSDLIGTYKPSPRMYAAAIAALGLKPEEVAMVAAHEWDLAAAREGGLRTIYVERWTEDRGVDRDALRGKFDLYINEGGIVELARRFGATP
ncbi:haloacid dehalogenase [Rhizoctonia solani 123E]|uniref:Haloacid dehalogenase n=1 Tax=Rhizoctonia solani 123E TaxID=1423351 RepID=A0A074S6G2_9AGAM|nr:haloacid dehalogenase [Rhizoctonia solani 123E]